MHRPSDSESEQERFLNEVDRYGQRRAEEAGTGLSDDMIPEYWEEFFSDYPEYDTEWARAEFEDSFRSGWDFYRYSVM